MQRTELLNQIILDICQCRLGSSIDALENLLLSNPKQSDMEKLVAIKNDYQLMSDYWQRGFDDPQRLQAAFPGEQHDAVIASLFLPIVQGLDVQPGRRVVTGSPDVYLPFAEDIERVAIRQQVVDIILLQLDQPVPLAQRRRRMQGQQDKY